MPTNGDRMGFMSSGPDAAQVESQIFQDFTIQADVTSFDISFDYNFLTEEYPEYVGSIYNDNVTISLITPGGGEVVLAYEDVNTSTFTLVSGIDFPGGDNTVGQTGWISVSATIPAV